MCKISVDSIVIEGASTLPFLKNNQKQLKTTKSNQKQLKANKNN